MSANLSPSASRESDLKQGIDMTYAEEAMNQAKRFFALSEEKKMEVFTGLVPKEYVGFHPLEHYNRNGWKHRGLSSLL